MSGARWLEYGWLNLSGGLAIAVDAQIVILPRLRTLSTRAAALRWAAAVGLMARKLPPPRGWKRLARSSFLSDVILNLLDSTTNMPFLGRPESVFPPQPAEARKRSGNRFESLFLC
jgi:hypothetical protein